LLSFVRVGAICDSAHALYCGQDRGRATHHRRGFAGVLCLWWVGCWWGLLWWRSRPVGMPRPTAPAMAAPRAWAGSAVGITRIAPTTKMVESLSILGLPLGTLLIGQCTHTRYRRHTSRRRT